MPLLQTHHTYVHSLNGVGGTCRQPSRGARQHMTSRLTMMRSSMMMMMTPRRELSPLLIQIPTHASPLPCTSSQTPTHTHTLNTTHAHTHTHTCSQDDVRLTCAGSEMRTTKTVTKAVSSGAALLTTTTTTRTMRR